MSANAKKLILLGVVIAIVAAFFLSGGHEYLTFQNLKDSQAQFKAAYQEDPLLYLAGYFLIYVVVVAANLPGAAVMTLAGGALFGLGVGLIVVSFASSIGATMACFLARYLLRDFVEGKFGGSAIMQKINAGVQNEGSFYLFTMRLIPIFPFFAINLVMGLTKMNLFTFYWVSQLGMLPGTAVYVNAGSQLATLESPAGVFSPRILMSFALLGIFPLVMKKLVPFVRAKMGKKPVSQTPLQ